MAHKTTIQGIAPILIAHRGYSGRYPENTLIAYQAAYQHGVRFMELDLQLTADQVPVLHHDVSLLRMAGIDLDVRDINAKRFKRLKAQYSERFEDKFEANEFTTFRRYCKWLAGHQDVVTFIEIKQQSIDRFGIPVVIDQVLKRISKADVSDQCVIISFNVEAIDYVRKVSSLRTGWVLPAWNNDTLSVLKTLSPDFVFSNTNLLPPHNDEVWQGRWQIAVYSVDDIHLAQQMLDRGIRFLETNQIEALLT